MAINLDDQEDEIVADINMTPLIDIMLVLLILFMVTSSIALESGLDVDLPQVSNETEKKEGGFVIISLKNQENLSVQGVKTSLGDLKQRIEEALKRENTKLVILEGDRKARLGLTVKVMDIAKLAGAQKFSIAAEASQ